MFSKSISSVLILSLGVFVSQQYFAAAWWFMGPEQAQQEANGTKVATATFDLDGVKGTFKFTQNNKQETLCEYDLSGLKGNNKFYHVHIKPVPTYDADKVKYNSTLIAQLCADPATGGHLNPHHITEKLPPKSAPFEKYETGDLSGKHGPMIQVGVAKDDHYVGTFKDDKLPMSGENSIIGRSIVIHKNDGKRWVCANIVEG